MVLRDASGLVVDSLNYGGLSDPWAAEGYQATSSPHDGGCFVPSPDAAFGFGPATGAGGINRSAGRFPDGADTDSNCTDFLVQPATTLPIGSAAGSTAIKVLSVAGFHADERILVDTGANEEVGVIATVGTAGATTLSKDTEAGATSIPVANPFGFEPDKTITVGSGADTETVTVASIRRFNGFVLTTTTPLAHSHAAGSQVSGTGLTLASALTWVHAAGAPVAVNAPTPGAPNRSEPAPAKGREP